MIGILTMNWLPNFVSDAEIKFYEIPNFRSSLLSVIRCDKNEFHHIYMLNSLIYSGFLPELLLNVFPVSISQLFCCYLLIFEQYWHLNVPNSSDISINNFLFASVREILKDPMRNN